MLNVTGKKGSTKGLLQWLHDGASKPSMTSFMEHGVVSSQVETMEK